MCIIVAARTLYDANGSCAPPTVPAVDDGGATYRACFCAYPALRPWRGGDGVPDGLALPCVVACRDDPAGLASLRDWYARFCAETVSDAPAVTQTLLENFVGTGSLVPTTSDVGSVVDSVSDIAANTENMVSPNDTAGWTAVSMGALIVHTMDYVQSG
ncbi:hypothetical protein PG996_014409 [Apiospora saccharicola]|uniref:Uncharacterized protein n=1 Tax=Apiospora saccharicola TaxID=335842 RepID=A0ABR1TI81_9PEZI